MKRLVIPLAILATFAFSIVSTPTVMAEDIWVLDATVSEYDLAGFADVEAALTNVAQSPVEFLASASNLDHTAAAENEIRGAVESSFDLSEIPAHYEIDLAGATHHGRDAVFRMTEVQHPLIMSTYNDYDIATAPRNFVGYVGTH